MKNRDATLSSDRLDNQEIGLRSRRRRPGLLTLASFALPVWLALAAYPAFAAIVGSRANNANMPMPQNGNWTTLSRINVPADDVVRYCVAVGSADVEIPENANGLPTYLFTLVLDVPQPPMNLGQEWTVQFVPGGPLIKEVTTTQGFILAPEVNHVIYWLGRPDPASPATTVLD